MYIYADREGEKERGVDNTSWHTEASESGSLWCKGGWKDHPKERAKKPRCTIRTWIDDINDNTKQKQPCKWCDRGTCWGCPAYAETVAAEEAAAKAEEKPYTLWVDKEIAKEGQVENLGVRPVSIQGTSDPPDASQPTTPPEAFEAKEAKDNLGIRPAKYRAPGATGSGTWHGGRPWYEELPQETKENEDRKKPQEKRGGKAKGNGEKPTRRIAKRKQQGSCSEINPKESRGHI